MKTLFKLFLALCLAAGAAVACYNDTALKSDIADLQGRVKTLEELVRTANGNISSLGGLVDALNGKVYINSVTETSDGYIIKFSDGKTATITNGKSPVIGVAIHQGVYYWTLDGEWLLDAGGQKIPVTGNDALAPQLKIDGGDWYVSTDGGKTWTKLGKATGEDGDSMFKSVSSDESFWFFVLANGDTIKIGRGIHGAKSVTVIPSMSDGSVRAARGKFTVSFDVLPAEAAEGLAGESDEIFTFKAVYTAITKASNSVILPILSKEGKEGTLLLTVDGSVLDDSFSRGVSGASACLQIVQGDNVLSSGYFSLHYDSANGYEYVDLGLPSGLKWATMNVGATKPEESGDYFAWGETEPKTDYSWSTYKFELGTDNNGPFSKYVTNSSYGTVDNKTVLDPEDDAAHVNWSGSWRMPTDAEWTELKNKCTWTWTIQNGINGRLVKGPNGKSIFLPVAGHRDGTSLNDAGSYGHYWSSSLNTYYPFYAYGFYFDPYYVGWNNYSRCNGQSVRPVYGEFIPVASISLDKTSLELNDGDKQQLTATVSPSNATAKDIHWASSDESIAKVDGDGIVTAVAPGTATITAYGSSGVSASCTVTVKQGVQAVDLGLPSGLKWASCNVGATKPEEYGEYFAWGETEPKTDYSWLTYKWCNGSYDTKTKYNTSSSYGTVDNKTVLDPEDDAANVNWGGSWRMPTAEECDELINNCTWTWTTENGVKGSKLTGPNGKSIFLPAAGDREGAGFLFAGSFGYYWSSSLDTGDPDKAYNFFFNSNVNSNVYWNYFYIHNGQSVRPVTE